MITWSVIVDIDKIRRMHLSWAEALDAWRIVPRILVGAYAYMVYKVVVWYMNLHPYMIENCKSTNVSDCIVQAPTNQHAALVTAVVGIAAAVFGLYAGSGKKWGDGFKPWKKKTEETPDNTESTDKAEES